MIVIDDQKPSTSAAARAELDRANAGEEIAMESVGEKGESALSSQQTTDDSELEEHVPRYLCRDHARLERRAVNFLYFTTVILQLLKTFLTLSVLFTDVEMDHLCQASGCTEQVYTISTAVYFLACLTFLILSVVDLFIGLNMFTRYPDVRCQLILDNVTLKEINGLMKAFAVVTAVEILVTFLATLAANPDFYFLFPCCTIISIEIAAILCVFFHPSTSAYSALRDVFSEHAEE